MPRDWTAEARYVIGGIPGEDESYTYAPSWRVSAAAAPLNVLQRAVVTDGRIVTSRGPGTAMDFALELIERLLGQDQA